MLPNRLEIRETKAAGAPSALTTTLGLQWLTESFFRPAARKILPAIMVNKTFLAARPGTILARKAL
ncbi:hypothetical protein [Bradyrhizobium sp. 2TAF24]|uniref:hypothetical protein n=1 Tax=Bradyrhizobium sp. 2TAF24 TaxID=3233011 RepID=UPI003F8F892E